MQENTAAKNVAPIVKFNNPVAVAKPTGYSHAAVIDLGTCRMVILSGQVPHNENGKLVGKGDLQQQTKQVFLNIKNILESLGGTMDNLVKTTIFMTDISQLQTLREVRGSYITSDALPASTVVQVNQLFSNNVLIEIEATAILPSK